MGSRTASTQILSRAHTQTYTQTHAPTHTHTYTPTYLSTYTRASQSLKSTPLIQTHARALQDEYHPHDNALVTN